jgi:hypothetical protein
MEISMQGLDGLVVLSKANMTLCAEAVSNSRRMGLDDLHEPIMVQRSQDLIVSTFERTGFTPGAMWHHELIWWLVFPTRSEYQKNYLSFNLQISGGRGRN